MRASDTLGSQSSFFGGSTQDFAAQGDMSAYFSNFMVCRALSLAFSLRRKLGTDAARLLRSSTQAIATPKPRGSSSRSRAAQRVGFGLRAALDSAWLWRSRWDCGHRLDRTDCSGYVPNDGWTMHALRCAEIRSEV